MVMNHGEKPMTNRKDKLKDAPERRMMPLSDFEFRKQGDSLSLDGYASVFNNKYSVMGGAPFGWDEKVDKRAFDETLKQKPDLHLLINHEGMPLARTKSGTLKLSVDDTGLRVQAPNLDRRDPDVQRLEVKMERGDMDEMSFAFRVKGDSWNDDESERTLTEVSLHKGDVSVVNFGANPATSAKLGGLRSVLDYLDTAELEEELAELRGDHDTLERLVAGRDKLSELYRTLSPKQSRTLSLADALAVVECESVELDFRSAVAPHKTATVDKPWDGPANVARLKDDAGADVYRKVFAWAPSGSDMDSKSAWKFPHHEVSADGKPGAANLAGCRNGLARLSSASIPAADREGVRRHLEGHLNSAGDDGGDGK